MQIFNDKKKRIGTLSGFKDREITTTLDSGDKELAFSYPAAGALVDLLKEEYYIRTKTDEFVLKAVEKGEQFNKYTAVLNVEELEGTPFPYGFESNEQTIKACLEFAFEGTGWHVGTCTVTKKRTIDEQESVTAWDVLQKCLTTYRCECIIHSLTKTIDIYDRIGSDKGCYFMEGLNLRKISLKSDTYDFYTRIYPIGKDGITPEWLTGKDYIDNFQYSSKIKAYVWKDERYTNTTSLIEDATAKIEEMSRPYKAYTAEVVDLAKASEEYKDILSYGIGDTVTLVSKKTRTREKQRIVKITEYPESPEKNTVEISNARKTFAEIQKEDTSAATEEAISIANNNTKKVLRDGYYTKTDVESHITAAKDEINLGVSKTLENYSTKEDTKAEIQISASDITQTVSENYYSKSEINNTLGDYATSSEVSTRFSQTAHSVSISASSSGNTAGITIALYDENGNLIDTTKTANITITGFVSFQDLANAGQTTINGANITTGNISCDRLSGGTIKGQKLEGCKAEFDDGAESLRMKYSDDYYMGLRAGYIYCHHNNPGNIYQSIVFDNLMRIGVNSNADCWGNGSGSLEPTYYMEINKYGSINFNCYNLTKNNSAIATVRDIPDTSNFAPKSSPTLSNATLTGNIDAIGIKGRSSSASANVRCQDGSSTGYLAIAAKSSQRYKHDIADITDDKLNPERLYDLPIRQFVYNLDYLDVNDQRYGETVCGFIAEEIANVYPVACEYNADGAPENWDIRYVIPPMLSLIQKQHQEIESLKQENIALKNRLSILEKRMEEIQNEVMNKNN